jgi:holin-like protein
MIWGMAMLLCFQLAGEIVASLGRLPISGPMCGMAALLVWLHFRGNIDADLARVCDGILANMAILFVPVGVGAMSYAGLFAGAWPVIALAILAGAAATLATSVFVIRALLVWTAGNGEPDYGVRRLLGEVSAHIFKR